MRFVKIVLLLLWVCPCFPAKKPGIYTVLNERFFERETEAMFEDLADLLVERTNWRFGGKHGRLSWGLDNLAVYYFDGPTSNIDVTNTTSTEAVFTMELEDATIKTTFDWWASYDAWFTDISISGSADTKMYNIDLTKSVALEMTEAGKLELDSVECGRSACCQLSFGSTDISVYGGAISWIIDKTLDWWKADLEDMIKREACRRIDEVIHRELNPVFREFPSHTNLLHHNLLLNYTLTTLAAAGDCLLLGVDGQVTHVQLGEPDENPMMPDENPMMPDENPVIPDENPMITITLGNISNPYLDIELVEPTSPVPREEPIEFVYSPDIPEISCKVDTQSDFMTRVSLETIQSLTNSIFYAGFLGSYEMNKTQIQKIHIFKPGMFIRSDDFLIQHYLLKLNAEITQPPTTSINTNTSSVDMEIPTRISLVLLHPNKSKRNKLLLTIDCAFLASLRFEVENQILVSELEDEDSEEEVLVNLVGRVLDITATVHNATTNDYDIELEGDSVAALLDIILSGIVRPKINKHMAEGIPTNFGDLFELEIWGFTYHEDYVDFEGTILHWNVQ